ncbi:peptidoglycan-binding domain-containing protein [Hyphomicrobium sp. CS1GBMeth3]|uniref:peptidoglycan-binding domain-containing protein n=1 Tax=Hyphomicrobium sp. CS1GBMeth3 TaxID=1892845 RepID=UPI0015C52EB3|nr:peptidoglycan-binding domain-containing protein [Hyphomicrobium sp. CS1GBMeth3]
MAGAVLLNELAKGTGKRKAAKPQRSKKGIATKPKKQRQRPKETTPEVTDDVAAVKKAPANSSPPKNALTTGATAKPAAAVGGASIISRPDEIKAAQQHLRFMGYDVPNESGTVDVKTKSAVMQFQDSIGVPVTGDLTSEQLRVLFMKVAGKKEGPQ